MHVNKRVKCRNDVQLPVETLLQLYKDPAANSFIIVSIIFAGVGGKRKISLQTGVVMPEWTTCGLSV